LGGQDSNLNSIHTHGCSAIYLCLYTAPCFVNVFHNAAAHVKDLLAFHQFDRVEGLRLHRLAADILHVGESVHQEISLLFDLCITNFAQCFSHKSMMNDL
jgi:hypothetical protein